MVANKCCILGWIHLHTRLDNKFGPCCIASAFESTVDFNSQTMRNMRLAMLNGEEPDICKRCWNDEANNHISKRQRMNNYWQEQELDIDSIFASTDKDGYVDPKNIISYDVRYSNLCNLKCIMCNSRDSTAWNEDSKIIYNKTTPVIKNIQVWEQLHSHKESIRYLDIIGGEPLLFNEQLSLLRELVNDGYSKDITLGYTTNCMIPLGELSELWQHFKHVHLTCSLEGLTELNEYIRFPSKWTTIVNFLDQCKQLSDNVYVQIRSTALFLNIEYLCALFRFIELKYNFPMIVRPTNHPDVLSVTILPLYIKKIITEDINAQLATINNKTFKDDMHNTLLFMNAKDNSHLYGKGLEFLNKLEKLRKNKYPFPLYERR